MAEIWDALWWVVWIVAFLAYAVTLFALVSDVLRDERLRGWAKALWLLFLIVAPFIAMLVYLLARGRGMAARARGTSA